MFTKYTTIHHKRKNVKTGFFAYCTLVIASVYKCFVMLAEKKSLQTFILKINGLVRLNIFEIKRIHNLMKVCIESLGQKHVFLEYLHSLSFKTKSKVSLNIKESMQVLFMPVVLLPKFRKQNKREQSYLMVSGKSFYNYW
jgi:hypothetical protein